MANDPDSHPGGGFNPPEPTTQGGPDYGRFVEAVRTLQDHARAADAPDDVIAKAADMIEAVNQLLAPFEADEWTTPSGRRMDLPDRLNLLQVPPSLGDRGRRSRRLRPLPALPPGPQRCGARRCGGSDVGFGARVRGVPAQPQLQAAHRVSARQLPPDRAHRQGPSGSMPASTGPRAARSSWSGGSSTVTRCSAMPRRCS